MRLALRPALLGGAVSEPEHMRDQGPWGWERRGPLSPSVISAGQRAFHLVYQGLKGLDAPIMNCSRCVSYAPTRMNTYLVPTS